MKELWELLGPKLHPAMFVSETIVRLLLAAFLGGMIGLEREVKRKPAGLRTNMFICFGAALYTVLSFRFAPDTPDKSRIAAQIITGIGFIGAGSILHEKGGVTGLTTAATLFVVAAIGMAAGGGEYLPAIFATMVILIALNFLGWLENRLNFKAYVMRYEVCGQDPESLVSEVNGILENQKLIMKTLELGQGNGLHRLQFTVSGTRKQHDKLTENLRADKKLEKVAMVESSDYE